MNISGFAEGLDKVLAAVQTMAPVAKELGIGGPLASLAGAAATIGRNVLDRVEDGQVVMQSHDKAKVEAVLTDLQAENDRLNKLIQES